MRFPTSGFDIVPQSAILEEEQLDEFKQGKYFPVQIGDVYRSKYQVLGKLGFGSTSTVWLARDLELVSSSCHQSLPQTAGQEG